MFSQDSSAILPTPADDTAGAEKLEKEGRQRGFYEPLAHRAAFKGIRTIHLESTTALGSKIK